MGGRRGRRAAAFTGAVLFLVALGQGCITSRLAERYADSLPRDPATGVVLGAESKRIEPSLPRGAVLLVHGFVGSPKDFGALPETLADDGWLVEALLLPGNGTDPRDLRDVAAEGYVALVRERIADLRADHGVVALVGFSMGGAVAVAAAAEEPVDALVLGAPFAGVTYRWYYLLPLRTWGALIRPVTPWVYKGKAFIQVNRPEAKNELFSYDWIPAGAFQTLYGLGDAATASGVPEAVKAPVLWIHAPRDVAASYGAAHELYARLGSASKRHVKAERSNHHVFVDYDRELVVEEVRAFLADAATTTRR